jgi:acyl carrier protein
METVVTTGRDAILATVLDVLGTVMGHDLPPTDENTQLLDELRLDSTRVLELLMELEDALAIEFDIDSLEQRDVETVGSLTDYVIATRSRTPS